MCLASRSIVPKRAFAVERISLPTHNLRPTSLPTINSYGRFRQISFYKTLLSHKLSILYSCLSTQMTCLLTPLPFPCKISKPFPELAHHTHPNAPSRTTIKKLCDVDNNKHLAHFRSVVGNRLIPGDLAYGET